MEETDQVSKLLMVVQASINKLRMTMWDSILRRLEETESWISQLEDEKVVSR